MTRPTFTHRNGSVYFDRHRLDESDIAHFSELFMEASYAAAMAGDVDTQIHANRCHFELAVAVGQREAAIRG